MSTISPLSTTTMSRVWCRIAGTSEARNISPLPMPITSGLIMRTATMRPGSAFAIATNAYAPRPGQRRGALLKQIAVVLMGDQMSEHLGVGLGSELRPSATNASFSEREVLDDPVVDYDDLATGVGVRMSVAVAGDAMRRPPGVPDAERASERMLVEYGGESGEFPLGLGDRQVGAIVDGDSGGVVAAVLEPAKSVDDDRGGVLPPT